MDAGRVSTAVAARSTSAVRGARKGGDDGPVRRGRDRADRSEVAVGGNREPGLDNVHSQGVELAGEAQFLDCRHAEAGSLFAVAQGGIEDPDPGRVAHVAPVSGF